MTHTVRSMTGYGSSAFEVAGARYRIEIRSVNHRHLNIRNHLPPGFSHTEPAMKRVLRDLVIRGSVDVSIALEDQLDRPVEVLVDEPGAQAVMQALGGLAASLGCEPPTLDLVLRQGDFVRMRDTVVDPEELSKATVVGLTEAVTRLNEARCAEGRELAADLTARLENLDTLLGRIEEAGPVVFAAFEARLRQRLEDAMETLGKTVDEGRLAAELVVFSDRCDVTEETVRARAHVMAFRALLTGETESDEILRGKRCEFLTQELGREFNTIGSKCREAGMASDVVDAKVELERIREQVQNIA